MGDNMMTLDSLSIEQLGQLSKKVDAELEFFVNSINELKKVQTKFEASGKAVHELKESEKSIAHVPLSESMYIEAELVDKKKFLVDVGTGYYVEMDDAQAESYFKRKQDFLQNQMDQLSKLATEKKMQKAMFVSAIQQKVAVISQQTGPK